MPEAKRSWAGVAIGTCPVDRVADSQSDIPSVPRSPQVQAALSVDKDNPELLKLEADLKV